MNKPGQINSLQTCTKYLPMAMVRPIHVYRVNKKHWLAREMWKFVSSYNSMIDFRSRCVRPCYSRSFSRSFVVTRTARPQSTFNWRYIVQEVLSKVENGRKKVGRVVCPNPERHGGSEDRSASAGRSSALLKTRVGLRYAILWFSLARSRKNSFVA